MFAWAVALALCTSAGDPASLGSAKELFLDDHLVESLENVARAVQPARKYEGNPVIRATLPWEGKVVILYGSVMHDGGKFRAWYHCDRGVAYAESADGIRWAKQELDVVDVDGHKTNLVIDRERVADQPGGLPYYYELFGVLKDPNETDPARRYKMGYLSLQSDYTGPREDPLHKTQRRGLGVAGSPDGIHWTLIDSWSTEAICDGATHWMYDPAGRRFVLYGRTQYASPEVKAAWANDDWFKAKFWGRSSARVESPDFLKWNFVDMLTAPVVMTSDTLDLPATEIYGMGAFPWGAGYVGLVQVFHSRPEGTILDIQLAYSRDTEHFARVSDRTPFIPCGPIGSWDRFNNSLATNPPVEVGDELRFYYGGRTYRHNPYGGTDKGESGGAIGFATVKRDRFVALEASFHGGRVVTKPLILSGSKLHVNAKSDFGSIVVETLDDTGQNGRHVEARAPGRSGRGCRVGSGHAARAGHAGDARVHAEERTTLCHLVRLMFGGWSVKIRSRHAVTRKGEFARRRWMTSLRVFTGLVVAFVTTGFAAAAQDDARSIAVVFRMDDYSMIDRVPQHLAVLDVFKQHKMPCTLAIIPFAQYKTGDESQLKEGHPLEGEPLAKLRALVESGTVEPALHGYAHKLREGYDGRTEFAGLDVQAQRDMLAKGKGLLESGLGRPVPIFVPPWNSYDTTTIAALQEEGFRILSGDRAGAGGRDIHGACAVHLHPARPATWHQRGAGLVGIEAGHHHSVPHLRFPRRRSRQGLYDDEVAGPAPGVDGGSAGCARHDHGGRRGVDAGTLYAEGLRGRARGVRTGRCRPERLGL